MERRTYYSGGIRASVIVYTLVLIVVFLCLMFLLWEKKLRIAEQDKNTILEQNLSSLKAENSKQKEEILSLRKIVSQLKEEHEKEQLSPAQTEVDTLLPSDTVEVEHDQKKPDEQADSFLINSRISSIDKFVPLTDEQRERLRRKFTAETSQSGQEDNTDQESLEDIIGAESVEFYREQRTRAMKKSELKELEKETLYLSRKLALDPSQEDKLRDAMFSVDDKLRERTYELEDRERKKPKRERDPRQVIRRLMEEFRLKSKLLREEVETFLSPEQYQLYLELEAEAPEADLEVWHATDE